MSSPVVYDYDMQRAHRELQMLIERQSQSYRRVLDHGRANDTDDKGNSALRWACPFGYINLVNALLANGADPNMKPSSGDPPLLWAVFRASNDPDGNCSCPRAPSAERRARAATRAYEPEPGPEPEPEPEPGPEPEPEPEPYDSSHFSRKSSKVMSSNTVLVGSINRKARYRALSKSFLF